MNKPINENTTNILNMKGVANKDPWDSVTVKNGKLSGGILTESMINTIYPRTDVSVGKGLLTVNTKDYGRKPIIKVR